MKIIQSLVCLAKHRLSILALLICVSSLSYAQIYLEFPGSDIKGESRTVGYEEQIEVLSFSEAASNSVSLGTGTGGGAGRAAFGDLSISKVLDSSSPLLRLAVAQGQMFPDAVLTIVSNSGRDGEALKIFTIELKELAITSVSASGAASNQISESVSIAFTKIRWTYYKYDDAGRLESTIEEQWNIETNTSTF